MSACLHVVRIERFACHTRFPPKLTGCHLLVPVLDGSGRTLHPPRTPKRAPCYRASNCRTEASPARTAHKPHRAASYSDAGDNRVPVSTRRRALRRPNRLFYICKRFKESGSGQRECDQFFGIAQLLGLHPDFCTDERSISPRVQRKIRLPPENASLQY